MIELSKVVKHYGSQEVLKNISFSIKKGEVVGFLGPNGAGKSTTMKIITGFVKPDSGLITVGGVSVQDNSLETRKMIGYLPEHNPLYKELYVKEYLSYVAGLYAVKPTERLLLETIERTGLTQEYRKKIGALSKGYRQRVGLAQTLIHDPSVLILDEPTTGLDPNQIEEIRALITHLAQDKTILLSTHILQEVEAICDRTIILDNGTIVVDEQVNNAGAALRGKHLVEVQFKNEVLEQELKSGIQLLDVKPIGTNRFLLSSDYAQVNEQVFDFAVGAGNKILEIHKKETSLNEVFKQVTKH